MTLEKLKELDQLCKKCHVDSIDIVCPTLAGLSYSLETVNRENMDFYDTLGKLSPEFQKDEDPLVYLPHLYKNAIFSDSKFEAERERLYRDNNTSFVDFFKQRQSLRQSMIRPISGPIGYNSNSNSRNLLSSRRSNRNSNPNQTGRSSQQDYLINQPLLTNGTIDNRSASFQSRPMKNNKKANRNILEDSVVSISDLSCVEEDEVESRANIPLKQPPLGMSKKSRSRTKENNPSLDDSIDVAGSISGKHFSKGRVVTEESDTFSLDLDDCKDL